MKYLDPIPHFYRKQPFWGPILTGRFADEYRFNTSVLPHKLPLSVKVDYVACKNRPRHDPWYVGWDVKPRSHSPIGTS